MESEYDGTVDVSEIDGGVFVEVGTKSLDPNPYNFAVISKKDAVKIAIELLRIASLP